MDRFSLMVAVVALTLTGCTAKKSSPAPASTAPSSSSPTTVPSTSPPEATESSSTQEPTSTGTTSSIATSATVAIKRFAFAPTSVTIKKGGTVTWTNDDPFAHTVSVDDGASVTFDSGSLGAGKRFSFTFDTPGTYPYHCDFHGQMTGTVVVQ